jgi:hypothetical protein
VATVNASLVSGLNSPRGIAVDGSGLFVANYGGSTIGEYTTFGGYGKRLADLGVELPTGHCGSLHSYRPRTAHIAPAVYCLHRRDGNNLAPEAGCLIPNSPSPPAHRPMYSSTLVIVMMEGVSFLVQHPAIRSAVFPHS